MFRGLELIGDEAAVAYFSVLNIHSLEGLRKTTKLLVRLIGVQTENRTGNFS